MKAIATILLFLMVSILCLTPVFGQGKFSLSASVMPYVRYANTKSTQLLPDLSTGAPTLVDVAYRQNGQGYSVGLMARYAVTAHWSISTGVLWNYATYKAPTITTTPDLATLNTVQLFSGSSHNHNYLIPILVNYQSSTKRLSPYFSAGATLNFRSVSFIDIGNGTETTTLLNEDVKINPIVGIGGIYQVSNRLSVIAQPTFSYLLPTGSKTIIYNRNYLFGLQAQLLYTF